MSEKEEAILNAAEKAFAVHGYKETSIRLIAKQANVNSAMLGYYFQSKEKLLDAVLKRRINRSDLTRYKPLLTQLPAPDKLRTIIKWHINMIRENMDFFRFILRENYISSSPEASAIIRSYLGQRLDAVKAVLEEGIAKAVFKPIDTDLAAMAISGTYVSCLLNPDYLSGDSSPTAVDKRLNAFLNTYIESIINK